MRNQFSIVLQQINEDGLLDSLLEEVQHDIALEIIATNSQQMAERENLYLLCEAVKRLKAKLQEYDNIYNSENF